MLTLNEALKIAGMSQIAEGTRETIMADLDKDERAAITAVEKELGKKVGEVSAQQVIDCMLKLFKGEIGDDAARYKELVADIRRAYKGEQRGSKF